MKDVTNTDSVSVWLIFFILAALLVNISLLFSLGKVLDPNTEADFDELKITFLETPECETCFDLIPFREYFYENGVEEDQINSVDYDSFKGKSLLRKYDITQVPTVIVHGDVNNYEFMQGLVESVGEIRKDDFIVTKLQPPYLDLEEGRVVGEFELIYLDDSSCEDCYDISEHDEVLFRLGLHSTSSRIVDLDSEEGSQLVESYFITAVPTILLKGELDPFEGLTSVWDQVGTIEEDGTYVLRRGVESMGTYKTLPDGEIITPEEVEAEGEE